MINTLRRDFFQPAIQKALKERKDVQAEKQKALIEIAPEFLEMFMQSNNVPKGKCPSALARDETRQI